MSKKAIVVWVSLLSMALAGSALADDGNGAVTMVLNGGSQGDVSFPHKLHQDKLQDCDVCHTLFPMEPGIIQNLIKSGKLKPKQVMQKCKICHERTKDQGHTAGPTSCDSCHDK